MLEVVKMQIAMNTKEMRKKKVKNGMRKRTKTKKKREGAGEAEHPVCEEAFKEVKPRWVGASENLQACASFRKSR